MQRINVYVDGFNFYYGLKSKEWKKYYWLDIVSFFDSFIQPHQKLENVYYCTALPHNEGKKERQDLLFSANKLNARFNLILGKFVKKRVRFGGKEYNTFEEKQTDVNIAVEMIRNVVQDKCDASVVVSADSDLIPPIRLIRELNVEHKIYCHFPPKRHSADLQHTADGLIRLERYEPRFRNAILPEEIRLPNGYIVKRPENWK